MDMYLTTISIWLCLSAAVFGVIPAASELLERYAQTQDNLQSYIIKSEAWSDFGLNRLEEKVKETDSAKH